MAGLILVAWTTYSSPLQTEGRAELDEGDPAPFAGVLLSPGALAEVRAEVQALRTEAQELREALDAERRAKNAAIARGDMWEKEARGGTGRRIVNELFQWGAILCAGVEVGRAIDDP